MFKCFEKQDWTNKNMILLDDEETTEKLPDNIKHVVVKNATIGQKLNIGVELSNSNYYHKWDDDDRYGPDFLTTVISPLLGRSEIISWMDTHFIFLVDSWKLYKAAFATLGGGTICFDREAWKQRQFKDISYGEDQDFLMGRSKILRVNSNPSSYILVRHGHNTWKTWSHGGTVEAVTTNIGTLLLEGPEGFFPPKDLEFYHSLQTSSTKSYGLHERPQCHS
jgi:hypothetical protein